MTLNRIMKQRLAGVLGIVLIGGFATLAFAISQRAFVPSTSIYVTADRAGLLLDKGAKVRLYGQPVGIVSEINLEQDNSVRLTVAIDEAQVDRVPADVEARISASTVFGAKQLDLLVPAESIAEPIAAGAELRAVQAGVEINDVMQSITTFAQAVQPAKLNATLSALASALDGRGDQLGQLMVDSGVYLERFNSAREEFNRDLVLLADVLQTYAEIAPDVVQIAGDATVTGNTLVENADQLAASLKSVRRAAGDTNDLLSVTANPLELMLTDLMPVIDFTDQYGDVITCIIRSMAESAIQLTPTMGGAKPGVRGLATFIPGSSGYSHPENLPTLVEPTKPHCYGLPVGDDKPAHYRFDDGVNDSVYSGNPNLGVGNPIQIYSDLVESFFGESGLNRLLQGE